jgi:hypothetical protein
LSKVKRRLKKERAWFAGYDFAIERFKAFLSILSIILLHNLSDVLYGRVKENNYQ